MADMIMIGDCGPGKSFKDGNDIFTSLSIDHNKTAMRGMIVKIKAKNLRTGWKNPIMVISKSNRSISTRES